MQQYDADLINDTADIRDVADCIGVEIYHNNQIYCPFPDHIDQHLGNCKITPKNNSFYCFACNKGGKSIDLVKAVMGLSFPEVCKFIGDIYGGHKLFLTEEDNNYIEESLFPYTKEEMEAIGLKYGTKTIRSVINEEESYEKLSRDSCYVYSQAQYGIQELYNNDKEAFNDLIKTKCLEHIAMYEDLIERLEKKKIKIITNTAGVVQELNHMLILSIKVFNSLSSVP